MDASTPDDTNQTGAIKLLSKEEVLARLGGVTYPSVWHWMKRAVDPFPRGLKLGSRVMWVESEVNAWIARRPKQNLKGD